MHKRARPSAIVPRSIFRTMATAGAVIPVCATAALAAWEPACTTASVACQGFGLNGSCDEPTLPAGVCTGSTLQLYTAPAQCSGQVYVVMPPSACRCGDAASYVACTKTGPTAYEGCACGSPPTGFTPACPTSASGLSACIVDAGHSTHADCGAPQHRSDGGAPAYSGDAGTGVPHDAFVDAP